MVTTETSSQLLDVLRRTTGCAELAYGRSPEPLRGGFWADLFAFSLRGAPDGWPPDLVARLMPEASVARKEIIVQAGAAAAGYPTPAVRVHGDAASGLGRAFMVMDRAAGSPLLGGLEHGVPFARLPRLLREIPERLASCMAALHALEVEPIRRQLAAEYDGASTLDALLDWFERSAKDLDRHDLADAAAALAANRVASAPDVLCHGDLHPMNVLVDDTSGAVTVLDWTAAVFAPREYDVAFTSLVLAEAPIELPSALRRPVHAMARRLAARFVRVYEQKASVTIDAAVLRRYESIVCLRALLEVAAWSAAGELDSRGQHPWFLSRTRFAQRLSTETGVVVRPS